MVRKYAQKIFSVPILNNTPARAKPCTEHMEDLLFGNVERVLKILAIMFS
jgi:hypothetical protein